MSAGGLGCEAKGRLLRYISKTTLGTIGKVLNVPHRQEDDSCSLAPAAMQIPLLVVVSIDFGDPSTSTDDWGELWTVVGC